MSRGVSNFLTATYHLLLRYPGLFNKYGAIDAIIMTDII
jgi:hypothetical protein